MTNYIKEGSHWESPDMVDNSESIVLYNAFFDSAPITIEIMDETDYPAHIKQDKPQLHL